jgi:hypothetical protein
MSNPERKSELPPDQAEWVRLLAWNLPKPTNKAEWDWYNRILNLPDDRWQRAMNSVFERTMAAFAAAHVTVTPTGFRRKPRP